MLQDMSSYSARLDAKMFGPIQIVQSRFVWNRQSGITGSFAVLGVILKGLVKG